MPIPVSQFSPLRPFPLGTHKFVLSICVSVFALQVRSSLLFFRLHIVQDILPALPTVMKQLSDRYDYHPHHSNAEMAVKGGNLAQGHTVFK